MPPYLKSQWHFLWQLRKDLQVIRDSPADNDLPSFFSSIFVREVSALKEKKENGSQSMFMDRTPNPNVTKKVNIYVYVYLIRMEMSSRGRDTNKFPTDFTFRCSGVQSCGRVWTSDKTKWPLGKKVTALAAVETTVYERQMVAGDAFSSFLARLLGHLPSCVMLLLTYYPQQAALKIQQLAE